MSTEFSLAETGLKELETSMKLAVEAYADTAEKHLTRAGNKLKKLAKEKSPSSGSDHRKKLKDSWKSSVKGLTGNELEYQLRNTAPHYHLVERGHFQVTKDGKKTGFIQGQHFLEKSIEEFQAQNIAGDEFEKMAADLKKKVEGP